MEPVVEVGFDGGGAGKGCWGEGLSMFLLEVKREV